MPTAHPSRATPIRQALARLLRAARSLTCAFRRAPTPSTPELKPAGKRHPGYTIARTTEWLVALARTLAGDRFFCQPVTYNFPAWPHRFPPFTAKLREECGLPPVPPRTEAQKAAAQLWYIRKTFAKQATGVIAARLARRLGLTKNDAAWPHALIAITLPPADIAKSQPRRAATPRPQRATEALGDGPLLPAQPSERC